MATVLTVRSRAVSVKSDGLYPLTIIKKACRARPKGYLFSPKYRQGFWDGWINLFKRGKFPTGLLGWVLEHLDEAGVSYKVKDLRRLVVKNPPKVSSKLNGAKLRPYQKKAAEILLSRPDGIVKMATNAGKTYVFAAMIKALPGIKTVIVVHSIDLLYQTRSMIEELTGLDVGVIGDSQMDIADDVNILTMQTLRTKFKKLCTALSDTSMLIVDECHHASADKAIDLLAKFPPVALHRRYGASGTPLHYEVLDDMNVIGSLGPIVYEITNMDLINAGFSTQPAMIIHPSHPYKSLGVEDMDYDIAYRSCIVHNPSRNQKIMHFAESMADGGPVLVIVNWIEHADKLMQAAGYTNAVLVTGQDSSEYRQAVLDRMRSGEHMIVVSTIFREGVDVPNISGLVIACGGSGGSHIRLLQAIGRAIRKKENMAVVEIHDFFDIGNPYLEQHSAEREALYNSEGFNVIRLSF